MAVIARTQHINADTVTAERSFADLGIDSLDGLNIIFALEEEFDVVIPDEEAKGYTTVVQAIEGVTQLVERKVAGSPPV
jgi:acyl carrier protein